MKVVYQTVKDQLDAAIIDAISSKRNIVRFEMTQEECDVLISELNKLMHYTQTPHKSGGNHYRGIPVIIID
jgi:hypothetical protein